MTFCSSLHRCLCPQTSSETSHSPPSQLLKPTQGFGAPFPKQGTVLPRWQRTLTSKPQGSTANLGHSGHGALQEARLSQGPSIHNRAPYVARTFTHQRKLGVVTPPGNSKIPVSGRAFTKNKHCPPLINLLSTPFRAQRFFTRTFTYRTVALRCKPSSEGDAAGSLHQEHCCCCLFDTDDAEVLPPLSARMFFLNPPSLPNWRRRREANS